MAKIIITSFGTLGDHLPYIELGKYLQKKGHEICAAFSQTMHPYAIKAGLEVASCGAAWGQQEAQQDPKSWDQLRAKPLADKAIADKQIQDQRNQIVQQEYPIALYNLLEICADADLLICSSQRHCLGAIVHEKLGIPWVATSVMPFFQCHNPPQPVDAAELEAEEQALDTDETEETEPDPFFQVVNEILAHFGLSAYAEAEWSDLWQRSPDQAILASSPHFSQLNASNQNYQQTGFFFYEDPDWQAWQPDEQLRQFVETEPKPLVLSFSSLPLGNAQAVLELHIRAAAKLGRRILIQQGWADFNESLLPEDCDRQMIMFAGFMPQDWLFSHAAALIHHGGMGTTARALRNDCPMLVEPYGNDQFFNAKQILTLKAGAVMHPHRITVDGLARVLYSKVLTDECKQNVQAIGAKIRAENSLETACNLIESWLVN